MKVKEFKVIYAFLSKTINMGFEIVLIKINDLEEEVQGGLSYDLIYIYKERKKECFNIELKNSCQKFGYKVCDRLRNE